MTIFDYFAKGQFDKTVSEYEKLQTPTGEDKLVAAGAYFRIGELTKSINLCEEIYNEMADRLDYISLYGAVLRNSGKLAEAKKLFDHGLEIGGRLLPSFMNNYSNLLVDLGDNDQALKILEELVSNDPNYQDAVLNIRRIKDLNSNEKLESTEINENELAFPEPDEFDPFLLAFSDEESQYTISHYLKKNQKDNTQDVTNTEDLQNKPPEKLNELLTTDNEELFRLAKANIQANPELTIKTCNKLIKKGCSPRALNAVAAEAYIKLSKLDLAELFYTKALAEGIQTVDIYVNLAQLCRIRNAFTEAFHYLEQAKKLDVPNEIVNKISEELEEQLKNDQNKSTVFPE